MLQELRQILQNRKLKICWRMLELVSINGLNDVICIELIKK